MQSFLAVGAAAGADDKKDPLRWTPWLAFIVGLLPFIGLAIRGHAENIELGIAAVLLCACVGSAWLWVKRHQPLRHHR
jgi:hypothetical protein